MLLLLTITQFIKLLLYTQTLTQFSRTRHFFNRNVAFLGAIQFHLINRGETHLHHVVHSLPLSLQFIHTTTFTPKRSNTFQLKLTCCCLFFNVFYSFMYSFIFLSYLQTSIDINFPVLFSMFFYFFFSFWAKLQWRILAFPFLIFFSHEIILCIDLEPLRVAFLASL